MSSKTLFAKTAPVKLFFIAAIPGALSMLASALYGLLDGIFVGRILGETAFAALNLAFPFVVINFSLADLIGLGSAVPIAISLGKKEEDAANNIFSCACLMIVLAGALVGGALYAAAPALIGMLGAEGELADMAVQYMRVYAICSPVTTIVFAMDNYLRICGKIKRSLALNILMAVIGAALEFTFLFIFKWGIWGAALATCTGMLLCALLALYPFLRKKLQLRFCRPKFTFGLVKQIITCGSPNFLNNIAGRITAILMNAVLLRMGGEPAVSIYGILMYLGEIVQPILYGVCDSLQPAQLRASQGDRKMLLYGQRRCFRPGSRHNACFSGAIMLVIYSGAGSKLFNYCRRGPAAIQSDIYNALVLIRHSKLYDSRG